MTKPIILTHEEVASMLTRAFHDGFDFTCEGFNGECAFAHLAPAGLTLEEKSAITVREILADHDAKLMTKPITLTDKEIVAIELVVHYWTNFPEEPVCVEAGETLRNLLERIKDN